MFSASWFFFGHLPGDFKRRLPRTPSTGTMSSADDLDEREPPSPSDCGNVVSTPENSPKDVFCCGICLSL